MLLAAFGVEHNDLPIDVYCLSVQADVLRLLDESARFRRSLDDLGDRSRRQSTEDVSASPPARPATNPIMEEQGGSDTMRLPPATVRIAEGVHDTMRLPPATVRIAD